MLALTGAAAVFAWLAWRHPRIPDPRVIPSLTNRRGPVRVDAGLAGRRFFKFIDENAGRKVRIHAVLSDEVEVVRGDADPNTLSAGGLCVRRPHPAGFEEIDELVIEVPAGAGPALTYSRGTWFLNGYFACQGSVGIGQGANVRRLTVIDPVTAVS